MPGHHNKPADTTAVPTATLSAAVQDANKIVLTGDGYKLGVGVKCVYTHPDNTEEIFWTGVIGDESTPGYGHLDNNYIIASVAGDWTIKTFQDYGDGDILLGTASVTIP